MARLAALPLPAALLALALAAPAAPARPGDLDTRLDGDGRAVVRSADAVAAFAPDGTALVSGRAGIVRLRGGRVVRRWRVRQVAPVLVAPRPGGGVLAVDGHVVRAFRRDGRRDRRYGVARLPCCRVHVVPRPDGGLLLVGHRSEADLAVRTQVVAPDGRVLPEQVLRRPDGTPFEVASQAVPDGTGGAWALVYGGPAGRALLRLDAAGALAGPPRVVRGELVALPGGALLQNGRTVARPDGTEVVRLRGEGRVVAVDAAGRVLVLRPWTSRLRRFGPDGRPDAAWPRHGVDLARGLPDLRGDADEPFARPEAVRVRVDGTIEALVRAGGLFDYRFDIEEVTRAFAVVRVEGEDLVRVTRASGGRVGVRCLRAAARGCTVRVEVRRRGRVLARRGLGVRAGATRTVRLRLPRGATALARAVDGRGRVASDRRRVR